MSRRFFLFTKSNIHQRKGNNKKAKENQSQNICVPKLNEVQVHNTLFLNLYAIYNEIILAKISLVKIAHLKDESIPGNTGETIATPNQKIEKLIRLSAITESKIGSIFRINYTLAKNLMLINGGTRGAGAYEYKD